MFWEFHRHIAGNDCEDGVVVVGTVCAKENGRKGNGRKESGRKEDGRKENPGETPKEFEKLAAAKFPYKGRNDVLFHVLAYGIVSWIWFLNLVSGVGF